MNSTTKISLMIIFLTSTCITTSVSHAALTVGLVQAVSVSGDTTGLDILACAPEIENGNLAAVTRILKEEMKTERFREETVAQEVIEKIFSLVNSKQQINALFDLSGIDKENKADMVNFVGGNIKEENIVAVKNNLQISKEKALYLANQISLGLRGQLQ